MDEWGILFVVLLVGGAINGVWSIYREESRNVREARRRKVFLFKKNKKRKGCELRDSKRKYPIDAEVKTVLRCIRYVRKIGVPGMSAYIWEVFMIRPFKIIKGRLSEEEGSNAQLVQKLVSKKRP
ncbi:hypothetical protein ACFL2R_03885 [Patescibacteria group bacterium]